MRPSAMPASLAICLVEVASKPLSANSPSAVSRICSRRAAASRCRAVGGRSVGALLPLISRPLPHLHVEWILVEYPLSIRRRPGFCQQAWDALREVLDAIFYVLRSGCAWRLLPHDFPTAGRPSTTTSGPGA